MKAIIIDDEQRARRVLIASLKEVSPTIEIVAEANDVPSGVLAINKHKPDVVFLDIEMPNYSGFELLGFFSSVNFEIIFVTAYNQYAIQAFEVSAVDYLLKPVRIDLLEKAIDKLQKNRARQSMENRLDALKQNMEGQSIEKIAVPVSDGLIFIEVSNILFIEADGSYVNIHLKNGDKMLVSKNLKYFEGALESTNRFYRVHRSFLVNLNAIYKYNRHENLVELENGTAIKVAREGKTKLEEIMREYNA